MGMFGWRRTLDFSLDWGGSISGRVMLENGAGPVSDVWVGIEQTAGERTIFPAFGGPRTPGYGVQTSENGVYLIDGLRQGSYRIFTLTDGILNHTYNKGDVVVEAGQCVSGIDFILPPLGSISGQVFHPDGYTPVYQAWVWAMGLGGREYPAVPTDAEGRYELLGLHQGAYYVIARYYIAGGNVTMQQLVQVTRLQETAGINFNLDDRPGTG